MKTFLELCEHDYVFGTEMDCAFAIYGKNQDAGHIFHTIDNIALYCEYGLLYISADKNEDILKILPFVRENNVKSILSTRENILALSEQLDCRYYGSNFMKYAGSHSLDISDNDFFETTDTELVFDILQKTNEHYKNDIDYEVWSADIRKKWAKNLCKTYLYIENSQLIGTGSIGAINSQYGVVSGVCVLKQQQKKGLGVKISRKITNDILKLGLVPVLMTGTDGVSNVYKKLGFETTHHWAHLIINGAMI